MVAHQTAPNKPIPEYINLATSPPVALPLSTVNGRWIPPQEPYSRMSHPDQKRGVRDGPTLPVTPATSRVLVGGSKPSRCNFLRASFRARRTASAFSRTFLSEGF